MCPRPVIGVPADRRILEPHPFHVVGEKYLQALIDGADALPLIIPVLAEHIDIDDILRHVDGVLLTGSPSNVEPHHYDGEPSEPGTLHDPHRDAATLPLTRRALDAGVPLLAVCRGFQELNVVLGGTLHQKVHEVPGYHTHRENPDDPLDAQYGPSHAVNLVAGGMLHKLAGATTVTVNSLHSQGVARLASGVTVEAVADDGLIEGFSVDSVHGFAVAVQWHPEWKVTQDDFSMAIFKAFGAACREYAGRRQV
ncbi:MAG: gamma-glutamyl-gamma-aminobutyrate hydrolase family protein [Gammaproteobacteria bacterium]|jgi:putative glutamine amidotransferase|nr:gamma-glutamyl-gamma-aminobutyrate hydrolase family protein [Gammaproteobacteria bacterium]MDH3751679.1 gamma-glutamyl-gamma-aminobutyrate hydrolase family protein [Gammaproteobacteria bacterium]MDH3805655.1 gamma-glutamyl-gamma-aminobutyrate hydrolase family protein [Gammaproteobacteria bacterium]